MNTSPLSAALRTERDLLAARWCDRVRRKWEASGGEPVPFDPMLAAAIIEEIAVLAGADRPVRIPLKHNADAFIRLGKFPRNVARCIEIFEAGCQTLGAFVVENTGSDGLWNRAERNRHLAVLDAIFHVLVHREIQGLCEICLHQDSIRAQRPAGRSPVGSRTMPRKTSNTLLNN